MAVPNGNGVRAGIDRDSDGFLDRDEIDECSDPADALSVPMPGLCGDPEFVRGDCNDSGAIDLSDPLFLLGWLFSGGATPTCDGACDIDDGDDLNIADAVGLLSYLFASGAPPEAPFPDCGSDPSAGALGCATFAACP